MNTDAKFGTFEDIVRNVPPEMASIAHKLRDIIAEMMPDVVEIPRPQDQHARYAIGPTKATEIFGYICPMKDYVRLGFYFGGALPDPKGWLAGEGKRLRHIKINSLKDAQRPEIRSLLKAAVQERKKALGLK